MSSRKRALQSGVDESQGHLKRISASLRVRWSVPDCRWTFILILLITAFGAYLRLRYARSRGFWADEIHTQLIGNDPATLRQLWSRWWSTELMQDPILFYILTWFNAHGSHALGLLRLRALPLLFGIASIPMIYLVVRRICSREVALVSALMMALSTFAIEYSQEYRPYSMLLFMSLLFYDSLLLICREFTWPRWTYLIISSLLLIYTHYFGGFVLIGGYIIWLAVLFGWDRSHPLELRAAAAIGLPLIVTLFYAPMLVHMPFVMQKAGQFNPLVEELYQASLKNVNYLWDLFKTMAAWRSGSVAMWKFWVLMFIAIGGLVALLARRLWFAIASILWVAITLPLSIQFYHWGHFPWDPRRNIWQLPLFVLFLSAGLLFPAQVGIQFFRGRRARWTGIAFTGILVTGVTWIYMDNWVRYSAKGYRDESRQADWYGMLDTIRDFSRPGDIAVAPITDPSRTFVNTHLAYYARMMRTRLRLEPYATMDAISHALKRTSGVWFILTEPTYLPKDLFSYLVQQGTWTGFFGGAVVFLPGASEDKETTRTQTRFAVLRQPEAAALAFLRPGADADVVVSGITTRLANVRIRPTNRYSMLSLSSGLQKLTATFNRQQGSDTTVALYAKLVPGQWRSGLDFDVIQPSSSMLAWPLHDGDPYLFMQHNGDLKYRFFLDEAGEYDLCVKAKHDRPGPITARVFFAGVGEVPPLVFDRKDNSFGEVRVPATLKFGLNEMTIYYNSFNRIQERQPDAGDEYNTFELMGWKLEKRL